MSVRVHAIAKEVNKTSKEIVEILKGRGYDIKSASSTLDNITAQSIIEEFSASNQEAQGTADPKEEQSEPSVEVEEKAEDTEPSAKVRKIPIVKSKEDVENERIEREESEKKEEGVAEEEEVKPDTVSRRHLPMLHPFRLHPRPRWRRRRHHLLRRANQASRSPCIFFRG